MFSPCGTDKMRFAASTSPSLAPFIFALLFYLLLSFAVGRAQELPRAAAKMVEITLEIWQRGGWQPVDPQTIFKGNDEIRVRFRAFSSGYLYVINVGSSGRVSWLYPTGLGPAINYVEPSHSYIIPDSSGTYVISGPAGIDTTYWILSTIPIERVSVSSEELGPQSKLSSRCRASLLRPRDVCRDENIGVHSAPNAEKVRAALGITGRLQARDLRFNSLNATTEVVAPEASTDGIMYEFRIAHH
jgi:hypothetical protein